MKDMGVDKKTKINYICINIEDTKKYIDTMRKRAEEDGMNDASGNVKYLTLSDNDHSFEMEEYYFDENSNEILINGTMKSSVGETLISMNIPLSDIVLLDILQHAIKKLNKLKTALETLS